MKERRAAGRVCIPFALRAERVSASLPPTAHAVRKCRREVRARDVVARDSRGLFGLSRASAFVFKERAERSQVLAEFEFLREFLVLCTMVSLGGFYGGVDLDFLKCVASLLFSDYFDETNWDMNLCILKGG